MPFNAALVQADQEAPIHRFVGLQRNANTAPARTPTSLYTSRRPAHSIGSLHKTPAYIGSRATSTRPGLALSPLTPLTYHSVAIPLSALYLSPDLTSALTLGVPVK